MIYPRSRVDSSRRRSRSETAKQPTSKNTRRTKNPLGPVAKRRECRTRRVRQLRRRIVSPLRGGMPAIIRCYKHNCRTGARPTTCSLPRAQWVPRERARKKKDRPGRAEIGALARRFFVSKHEERSPTANKSEISGRVNGFPNSDSKFGRTRASETGIVEPSRFP